MTLKKPKMVYPDFTSEASLGFFISDALIIGVDEVGRGCLAGPVVAAAAVVPKEKALEIGFSKKGARPTAGSEKSRSEIELHSFLQVKDSKLIPEKIRHALVSALDDQGVIHSIAEASVTEIAKLNILYASHLAMERAVAGVEKKLGRMADAILVDGNLVPKGLQNRGHALIKGDQKSVTIACASVFAKVYRDDLMNELDVQYPGYGLAKHKGYPTPFHKEQLQQLGSTEIHRSGFKGV